MTDATSLPDTDVAIKFLQDYFGDNAAPLTAIKPDLQGASSVTLKPVTDEARIRSWIDNRQGNSNLYFMVNPARRLIMGDDKAKKEDVLRADWLHVDIDPRAGEEVEPEKERALGTLANMPIKPNIIIDSGNGIQAFWKLENAAELDPPDERDAKILDVESRCHRIALILDADVACRNIDRIMRIPGTINVPSATKRRKGRVPVTARLLEYNQERRCNLDDWEPVIVQAAVAKTGTGPSVPVEFKTIPDRTDLNALVSVSEEIKDIVMLGRDPRNPMRWNSRSEMQFFVIIQLIRASVAREVIASILLDQNYLIGEGIREKRNAKEYALRQIRRAQEKANVNDRPIIEVTVDNIDQVVDLGEAALQRAGIEIFQRMGSLVKIVRSTNGAPLQIGEVGTHWLMEKFISSAKWVRMAGKELKPYEPKITVANTYVERNGEWRLPHLKEVVATPTLRPDYSLLSEPGYDALSNFFYEPGDTRFPPIPDEPTRDLALISLNVLVEPLRCFPFVPDKAGDDWRPGPDAGLEASQARSVALSAIITGVIRPALRTAPLHALDAPVAGTGKGKVADVAAIVAAGAPATPMSMGNEETEDRKRLFSALLTGQRVIVIDNVERPVGGEALCTIMTQQTWQDRVLSQSRMETVSTNVLIMATGNNMIFRGDMTRRAILCRMDAREEQPSEREFTFDPAQIAMAKRPELVVACLTIIRAYITAGRPLANTLKPMGSFEDWALVREALVWLDQPDPAETRRLVQGDDPHRAALVDMMSAWEDCYGREPHAISHLSAEFAQPAGLDGLTSKLAEHARSVCPNGRINARSLAIWFRRNSGKVVGGRRFIRHDNDKHGMIVRLDFPEGKTLSREEETDLYEGREF